MADRKCYYCDADMPKGTEHIKYDGDPVCMDCTDEYTITQYYVGGEYVGSDDDGDVVKVYAWEDQDNLEQLEDEVHES